MPRFRAGLSFKMPVKITKRRKWYLASCPLVDVHSQGDTAKQAKENLAEALLSFFTSCLERNTLDDVLKGCGLTVAPSVGPVRKTTVSGQDFVDVPIPFLVSRTPGRTCHV